MSAARREKFLCKMTADCDKKADLRKGHYSYQNKIKLLIVAAIAEKLCFVCTEIVSSSLKNSQPLRSNRRFGFAIDNLGSF